jgi:hypothetical protein
VTSETFGYTGYCDKNHDVGCEVMWRRAAVKEKNSSNAYVRL